MDEPVWKSKWSMFGVVDGFADLGDLNGWTIDQTIGLMDGVIADGFVDLGDPDGSTVGKSRGVIVEVVHCFADLGHPNGSTMVKQLV
jgi:hypothetical protein